MCPSRSLGRLTGDPENTHSGWLRDFSENVRVAGHRSHRNAGECRNGRTYQCFALVLKLPARSTDFRFCGFVPQLIGALRSEALPLGERQAAIELHCPSVATAITGVAIPRPATYGFDRGAYRRQRQVFRKTLF
ncbi:hypothetical protein ALO81_102189 [Pseudomonas cannabina]|uniref:Uncharacterized protein n=1 Tax=Pseudomonas cannabina TaxID=86840 RepID=A0A0P9L3Z1_PSECA|nr:hypothetical protein ALO81_102189 [Pseudomonas cannabina]